MRFIAMAFVSLSLVCAAPVSAEPVTADQLIEQLQKTADSLKDSTDPEVQAARSVLLSLKGSLHVRSASEMMKTLVPFIRSEIERAERGLGRRKS